MSSNTYVHAESKSVTFSVIANNDAHVGFFSDKKHESEVYEIVIGGWGNQRSAIRCVDIHATNCICGRCQCLYV